MEIVRSILIAAEETPNNRRHFIPSIDGVKEPDLMYHIEIMEQAGLISTFDMTGLNSEHPELVIRTITWEGQEFLSAARDDDTWSQAKQSLGSRFNGIGLDLLYRALTKIAWKTIEAGIDHPIQ